MTLQMTISDGKQSLTLLCNASISSLVYRGVITKNAIIQVNDFRFPAATGDEWDST